MGKFKNILKIILQLPKMAKLMWGLFKDARVPVYLKALTIGTLAYLIAPLDIIPDFIPSSGLLDDAILIFLVLEKFIAISPSSVVKEHMERIKLKESDFDKDLKLLKEYGGETYKFIKENLEKIINKYLHKDK